ncbi:MAG: ATP-dependent Clp protease proteolytic subunit [bacterium]
MDDRVIFSPSTMDEYIDWKLFHNRTIFIDEDIFDNTAQKVCGLIELMVDESSSEPITLLITSPGGSVYAAMAIHDTIMRAREQHGISVIAEARGYAASAAAVIMQAADVRLATRHTRLLIHEVSVFKMFEQAKASSAKEEAEEMGKVNDMLSTILAERSGHTLEEVNTLISKTDVWLSAEEAVAWGLIDAIV